MEARNLHDHCWPIVDMKESKYIPIEEQFNDNTNRSILPLIHTWGNFVQL